MKTIEFNDIISRLPHRPDDAHKGTMGTLCSITGSRGFSGAAVLSAKAALRSGVGLMYQIIPESVYPIFASSVYESVCVPVHGSPRGTVCPDDIPVILDTVKKATAVLIGCGMGNNEDTAEVLSAVLKNAVCPVIIDADGINALSSHIHLLDDITTEVILTPHIKEFSRLSGLSVETVLSDPAKAASDFAFSHRGVTLVLKSHRTYIARGSEPGSELGSELYENTAGNSGMAKGGSGDVLAGIIASLTAQGAKPIDAAAAGVHIHALAGDAAAAEKSKTAMLPSDIIEALPRIYSKAESASNK